MTIKTCISWDMIPLVSLTRVNIVSFASPHRCLGVQTLGGQKLTSFGQLHMGTLATKAIKLRVHSRNSGDENELIQFGCVIGKFQF